MATCFWCGGSGSVECDCTGGIGRKGADDDCPVCGGDGYCTCPECNGSGETEDED